MTEALTDIDYREEKLERPGGIRIFLRSWRPRSQARGVVAIVHGFNAHSGQYASAAGQFVASGLAVYAPDLRG
jgi:acylglycerol lipase